MYKWRVKNIDYDFVLFCFNIINKNKYTNERNKKSSLFHFNNNSKSASAAAANNNNHSFTNMGD